MADYVVVPYSNYTDAANLYTDGVKFLQTVYGGLTQRWSIASRINTEIRLGIALNNNSIMVILATTSSLSNNDFYLTYMNMSTDVTYITTSTPGSISYSNNGYNCYNVASLSIGTYTILSDLTLFNSVQECYTAITSIPIVNPGVHVSFNPVLLNHGVHVSFNPVLLDPNAQGGTSGTGGGDGTFDETSDAVSIPELPNVSVVDTGLVTLFRPSISELLGLSRYLWSHLGDLEINLQKLFTNPMDYFIAFNIFPVVPEVLLSRSIYIGNLVTNITMPPVANQWYEFNCGTVNLQKYWGSALDYAPNTKVQLMLPYIGSVQLNTDEVMGHTIGVRYRIDLLSGSCVAMVTVDGNVYYQFTGECSVSIPLTGADWSRIYSAVVGAVGTAISGGVGAVMTGNAGGAAVSAIGASKAARAASSAGNTFARLSSTHTRGVQAARDAALSAMQSSAEAAQNAASASGTVAQGIRATRLANAVNNTVGQVMSAKTAISHSGTISGSAGMLGVRDAYLIIEYPNQSLAQDYKHYVGYPSNIYARLGTLTGYTEVEQVIAEGIWGTDDELAELIESLKGGVYL